MKPIKLTMQAFGSYGRKTVIDFTKPTQNLFLITGDTGAGKTTIFDAIVFALYGEASSGSNKKDGAELQSQFVEYDVSPFVELTFSEYSGGIHQIYTVRRVPRHIRPLKKGTGVKDERETVSLTMPDDTEYSQNQKETDAKLEEIIGLSKGQFMQVAMIAQGEFMELLRADSNKKKEIFRKLFNTELFQKIVAELDLRRKAKAEEIAAISTACKTEAAHIIIPPHYAMAPELEKAKNRICSADRLNIADMDFLMAELDTLTVLSKFNLQMKGDKLAAAAQERDARRDAYQQGKLLLASFTQLEKAEADLAEAAAEAQEIKNAAALIQTIRSAYEIETVYERYRDADREAAATAEKLRAQEDALPALLSADTEAAEKDAAAKARLDAENAHHAKVADRVAKALEVFRKIADADAALQAAQKSAQQAQEDAKRASDALTQLEAQEQVWRQQAESLSDAAVALKAWEGQMQECSGLDADLTATEQLAADVAAQKEKVDTAQADYTAIREEFVQKNEEYIEKQTAFLDAQAGFIAKEKLHPQMPCPVCGSLEHPHPCELPAEHAHLTRDMIDDLARETEALQAKQTAASTAAGAARELLAEKEAQLSAGRRRTARRMQNSIGDLSEDAALSDLRTSLAQWTSALSAQGELLRKNAAELTKVQEQLRSVDGKKSELRTAQEAAVQKDAAARAALASSRAARDGLTDQTDFADPAAANSALSAAADEKFACESAYQTAHAAAQKAKAEREQAETRIAQFRESLPLQQKTAGEREAAYTSSRTEKGLSEADWQSCVAAHEKTEIAALQERIDSHNQKTATAQGALTAAKKATEGHEKPVLDRLQAEWERAESSYTEQQGAYELLKETCNTNQAIHDHLTPQMEQRKSIVAEHTKIESLYVRLAGKVSGARMDIETFVQRYYLQRVLYAANIRFQEMSAGQFELRMVDEEQAGEGKNRGLDLMVYSTVTGKEREIRTLSGGESFMAALSLALGMADQIQESSASVNLDMMFIDEGFGSLDDHSRDQAVKVLQQMASGSKLIGIISHVTELKHEIEDQLIVRKDKDGSFTSWQIS